jgi:hypothetical protein
VLLERFLEEEGPTAKEDPYEHVALILTNITRLPGGRRLLLAPGRRTLAALACQLAPGRSRMRRSGCASALRNCCFRAEVLLLFGRNRRGHLACQSRQPLTH